VFSTTDTIVAIATPPGRGGMGVVRVSGPRAAPIVAGLVGHRGEFEPRRATFTKICSLDHVVLTYFPAPHSYTGEDVVEVGAHGSPTVLRAIVSAVMRAGGRLAEPGEFTLRAFLNGRVDLAQAEAVADLIDAVTPLQARAAFDQLDGTLTEKVAAIDRALFDLVARLEASVDFPDEGYQFAPPLQLVTDLEQLSASIGALLDGARAGRMIREGLQISIVGRPNVGKSSLFNALAGAERAIVTAVPGTTRDLVTEAIDLHGLHVTLVDTAGQRDTSDDVESIGVNRARRAQAVADLVLIVLDGSEPLVDDDHRLLTAASELRHIRVVNKSDLPHAWPTPAETVRVSATRGDGVDALRTAIVRALDVDLLRERPVITNVRHIQLMTRALQAVDRARDAIGARGGALSEEFVLADLQAARDAIEEIVGRRASDDLLAHIFSRFCIGK